MIVGGTSVATMIAPTRFGFVRHGWSAIEVS
jgi:hypothetical protein